MKLILNYKKPNYNNNIYNYIIKETITINSNNNKIIYEKIGGDIFDKLSINDIIIKKDNIISKKKKYDKIYISNDLTLYDIKKIIFNLLGIKIENQHIEQKINNNYKNNYYQYINNILLTTVDTCLNNLYNNDNNIKKYEDIFIDMNLVYNRNIYYIKTNEQIETISNIIDNNNEIVLDIFNLEDFFENLSDNKINLFNKLKQDNELFNMIYYGFIEKYFPYYNYEIFELYINEKNIHEIYPELLINNKTIIDKCDNLFDINNEKIKHKIHKTINYRQILYNINSYNNIKLLDIQKIFDTIELKKINNLQKIEAQIYINDKLIYFSKNNILIFDNELLFINDKNYNKFINNEYNTNNILLFIYNINHVKYNIINKSIYIYIDEYKNIFISINNKDIVDLDLNIYNKIIIDSLNNLFHDLYKQYKIKLYNIIKESQLEIISTNIDIVYDKLLNINQFNELIKIIKNYENIDSYQINNINYQYNIIELIIKNNLSDFINENEIEQFNNKLLQYSNNFYNFYINPKLNIKYNKLINISNLNIIHQVKDIKLELKNINIKKSNIISLLIEKCLNKLNISNKTKYSNNGIIEKNKLKKLKETDPILYNFNKNNTNKLYSRKCQSSQQPNIINENELKLYKSKNKNIVKYWNFTKNKPEYYTCLNNKYPSVHFITGLHPNKYCLPCCKKKLLESIKTHSSYKNVHDECLSNNIYDKKNKNIDIKSRYINQYSPKLILENNRLMNIPNTLQKLFKQAYNVYESDDIYNYYIIGVKQNLNNIEEIGILHTLSFILDKSIKEIIQMIRELFINNPHILNNIFNGKLLYYFNNLKEFLILFDNIFNSKIILQNINYEFNKWNELLIDISKYFGIIFIVFENNNIDDNVENENINLIIPENIQNINELIYENDNYKYVLLMKNKIKNYNSNIEIINNKIIYYYNPISILNFNDYYSNKICKYKYFKYDNNLIKLLSSIIDKEINNNLLSINNHYTINLIDIQNFILFNSKYSIIKYYITNSNEIYAILILYDNKDYIYINVNKQFLKNISYIEIKTITNKFNEKLYTYDLINISNIKLKFDSLYIFITHFNSYIYELNKLIYTKQFNKLYVTNILLNNYNNNFDYFNFDEFELNKNELLDMNFNNLKHYIYIQKFIILNNDVIGVICNNNNIYINDKSININYCNKLLEKYIIKYYNKIARKNININDIKEILTRPLALLKNNDTQNIIKNKNIHYYNYYKIYLYHPLDINNIIKKYANNTINNIIKDDRINNLNYAIYHTNLYNLLLIHFINKILKIKNTIIRKQILNIFDKININDIYDILNNEFTKFNTIFDKIKQDNYNKYNMINNLLLFLKNIIKKHMLNNKINLKNIKIEINNLFNNTYFTFDSLYIYNILSLEKKEALKELDKIFKTIIIHSEKLNNKYDINNIELCNVTKNSYYCKDNKLIISKEIYHNLLDILYFDLINPFKQKIIFNLIQYNINNIYKFKQNINEQIYIYL